MQNPLLKRLLPRLQKLRLGLAAIIFSLAPSSKRTNVAVRVGQQTTVFTFNLKILKSQCEGNISVPDNASQVTHSLTD
jgi:hypothetical protein